MIQCADRDVDLPGVRRRLEQQRRAALRAKRADAMRPTNLFRLAAAKAKFGPFERCPRDERRAAAPAAVLTMAVGDVIRRARCFITHVAAQTAAGHWGRVHRLKLVSLLADLCGWSMSGRKKSGQSWFSLRPAGGLRLTTSTRKLFWNVANCTLWTSFQSFKVQDPTPLPKCQERVA